MGRNPNHDYKSRCIYHITIGKAPACPVFSYIAGSPAYPSVQKTEIGKIIQSHIFHLPEVCSSLQPLQYVIMPDHIHFALFVRDYLPKALGKYIGMMKVKCGQAIREKYPEIKDIFTPDFYDRFLRWDQSLDSIIE